MTGAGFKPCVVTTSRLRCLDHPVVDTGVEFASPSGAPLGYDRSSLVGEMLPGPAVQRAQSDQRVGTRASSQLQSGRPVLRVARERPGPIGAVAPWVARKNTTVRTRDCACDCASRPRLVRAAFRLCLIYDNARASGPASGPRLRVRLPSLESLVRSNIMIV